MKSADGSNKPRLPLAEPCADGFSVGSSGFFSLPFVERRALEHCHPLRCTKDAKDYDFTPSSKNEAAAMPLSLHRSVKDDGKASSLEIEATTMPNGEERRQSAIVED